MFILEHESFGCEELGVDPPPAFIDHAIRALPDLVLQLIQILEEVEVVKVDGGFEGALGDSAGLERVHFGLG